MADPKSYDPEKLTSGVTWKWKKTISDYPASEWTLTYYLRKSGATATSFSATADGDTHLVTVAAATTAGYAAVVYDIIGVVVKSAEKYVVYDGIIEVLTNPATAGAYDPRSHSLRLLLSCCYSTSPSWPKFSLLSHPPSNGGNSTHPQHA